MKNDEVIKAFNFLVSEYNCTLYCDYIRGSHYNYINRVMNLLINVWEEFDELQITLIYKNEYYLIDPYEEEPLLIKKTKGIIGHLFFAYSDKFWSIVAKIVRNKIEELDNK